MRASLLAIGDEIVGGMTTDTNSGHLSEQLRSAGVEVVSILAVADDEEAILRAFRRALEDAELVISTGGLGPTSDDLTTAVVARLAGKELRLDPPSLERIEEIFRSRGIEMTENNRKQALFPEGSTVLPNPIGSAPGFLCPVESGGRSGHVACLPGVPREMRLIASASLLPWVASRSPDRRFASRTFSTFGLAESKLDELLADVADPAAARLAFRAAFPRVQARLTVSGAPGEELEARLDAMEVRVRERLGLHLYGIGDEGLEEALGRALAERGITLAVAESCTGGLIGHRITEVPGSSAYYLLGAVVYSNEAKERLLGVRAETLRAHGAVSTEVAEEMAEGVRRAAGADLGLATTGIAGPGGGTEEKPVGTVCIALAWEGGVWSRRYELPDRGRSWVKELTAQTAMDRVRRWCLEEWSARR